MDGERQQSENGVGGNVFPTTPARSRRGHMFSDRFIPFRPNNEYEHAYAYASINTPSTALAANPSAIPQDPTSPPPDTGRTRYQLVLQNEIMGVPPTPQLESSILGMYTDTSVKRLSQQRSVLQYSATKHDRHGVTSGLGGSVVSADSRQLLCAPQKTPRRFPKVPFKVLDAPDLQDDFYLNLLDWSQQNVVCVALGSCVYLWNAHTGQVTKLCNLASIGDLPTAVTWLPKGQHLAVGTNRGTVLLWDVGAQKRVRSMGGHTRRVCGGMLVSGGGTLDKTIRFWDTQMGLCSKVVDTGSQVCNLAWSKTSHELVSTHGYQENQIVIWKCPSMTQVANLTGHTYRVLYLAMSPDGQTIVTGAGDETLRVWSVFNPLKTHTEPTSVLLPYNNIR